MREDERANPAEGLPEKPKNYRPMTSAVLRLEVPKRAGYHRHWFRGDPNRIARAQQAGYRFVDQSEVDINNFDLGGDANADGNSDLGSRVSVVSGEGVDTSGQPGRLYLMEIPEEWYADSQRILEERNDSVAEALRGGVLGAENESGKDRNSRYVPKGTVVPDLFTKNKRNRSG